MITNEITMLEQPSPKGRAFGYGAQGCRLDPKPGLTIVDRLATEIRKI